MNVWFLFFVYGGVMVGQMPGRPSPGRWSAAKSGFENGRSPQVWSDGIFLNLHPTTPKGDPSFSIVEIRGSRLPQRGGQYLGNRKLRL